MKHSWMYGDRREKSFQKGVAEFCKAALEHQAVEEERLKCKQLIYCPCRDCANVKGWDDIHLIENHLFRHGFRADYETWYWHREKLDSVDDSDDVNDVQLGANPCDGNDNEEEENDGIQEDQMNDMMDRIGDHLNVYPRMFEDLSNAADTPLYPGCTKYTKLSAVLLLCNLQAKHGLTDVGFSDFLEAIEDMMPQQNVMPKSAYYAKKLINPLGLGYTKIDACPNDCVLYRKDYENLDACPKCGLSRYKEAEGVVESDKRSYFKVISGRSQSNGRRKTGRGPSKPVQMNKPMILEFDEFDLLTGRWEKEYGQQLGQCASRIDINIHKWKDVDQAKKDTLWAETKRFFCINDP